MGFTFLFILRKHQKIKNITCQIPYTAVQGDNQVVEQVEYPVVLVGISASGRKWQIG